jgi:hypothetical protein
MGYMKMYLWIQAEYGDSYALWYALRHLPELLAEAMALRKGGAN